MKSPTQVLNLLLYDFVFEINGQLFSQRDKKIKRKQRKCFPAWHNNVVRHNKDKEKEEIRCKTSPCCWDERESDDEDELERQKKEHFDSWLQDKIKQEKEIKRKQKRAEEMVLKIKKDKEIIQSKLRTIMKEEWLKKKTAQEKEEIEKKRRDKEVEELEKKKKEMLSKIKVNQWMKQSNKRLRRPVDQSLYSAKELHIGFVNPEPWRSNLDENDD